MIAYKDVAAYESWPAFAYYRLSDADERSGVEESNSITNQRRIVEEYVRSHPDIQLIREWVDDGLSGVYFDRPAFMEMMDAIRRGEARCILVKDLSRFGRDYIEVGSYVERIFPFMKVRFVAVNDDYDSAHMRSQDRLLFPFKNIMNDAYSRDASVKVRSSLRVKRQRGEFVNAFTRYGYMRLPQDRSCVVPDPVAAAVVRFIFNCRLEGMSPGRIASLLNDLDMDSPLEHKRRCGEHLQTSFKRKARARWGTQAVLRILQDETCLGVLTLGRTTTPNHKIRTRIPSKEPDLVRHEHRLIPLVREADFHTVRRMLGMDTRMKGDGTVRAMSGIVYCAVCGRSMTARPVGEGEKRHCVLICPANKQENGSCTGCMIREDRIEEAIWKILNLLVQHQLKGKEPAKLRESIAKLTCADEEGRGEVERQYGEETAIFDPLIPGGTQTEDEAFYRAMLEALYEDYRQSLLTAQEYEELRLYYTERLESRKHARQKQLELQAEMLEKRADRDRWNRRFLNAEMPGGLTANLLLRLIDRIEVRNKHEIKVCLLFGSRQRPADGERHYGT